ncbi:DoxX family protein [Pseudomonas syringae]|uniref:DoxX family protein n=1 Tax=Pseudomonas syringae TaxID=317 RepID=UPI000BB6171A|nr:DoxX family protein [Pseudomonas syringae]PBQ13278.1 DoxX family protein [Pseudomonas syringae]POP72880.1 DoxX family protein [Pseudomonas syringae pv. syringae]
MSVAKFSWKAVLAFLLAAFFLIGAIGNIFVPPEIAADYARWGYPSWFHYVTGSFELSAAILIAIKSMRFWGAVLGSAVMVGAAGTVLLHGEFTHAVAPLVVLAISLVVGWSNKPGVKQ